MSHFPILKYDATVNFKEQQIAKLYEELLELKESKNMSMNELEECLDIIQICISLVSRHNAENIKKMFKFHRDKLCIRGWESVGQVLFTIKKD
jgi:predicted house-cleaning noncanonical NTP pyrophosphatase (MazG superfamily)